jgi:hypothetical protein
VALSVTEDTLLVLPSRFSRSRRVFLALLLSAGCVKNLGTESATSHSPKAGTLLRDCVVPMPAAVAAWSAPASIAYPDGALWILQSATLGNGSAAPGAAIWIASADAACAGPADLLRRPNGGPAALLVLDDAETSANAARTDGRALALVPKAGFSDGGLAYLYYDHVLAGPGPYDIELLGTGMCVLDTIVGTCARAVDDSGSTVLWLGDELPIRSAFVDAGMAYLLACRQPASLMQSCVLARVAPSSAGTAAAYEYFDAFQGWGAGGTQGTQVIDDLANVSLSYNPFHGRYTVVLTNVFDGKVSLRLGSVLDGSFGNPIPLFNAVAPAPDSLLDGGAEQTSLRGDDGRVIHVAYAAGSFAARELHLASFQFDEVLK